MPTTRRRCGLARSWPRGNRGTSPRWRYTGSQPGCAGFPGRESSSLPASSGEVPEGGPATPPQRTSGQRLEVPGGLASVLQPAGARASLSGVWGRNRPVAVHPARSSSATDGTDGTEFFACGSEASAQPALGVAMGPACRKFSPVSPSQSPRAGRCAGPAPQYFVGPVSVPLEKAQFRRHSVMVTGLTGLRSAYMSCTVGVIQKTVMRAHTRALDRDNQQVESRQSRASSRKPVTWSFIRD